MSALRRSVILVLAGVLAVCVAGSLWTRSAMEHLPFLKEGGGGQAGGVVDQRPWQTAQALAALAVSKEEQGHAREAERLADHEVDQAFQTALRRAAAQATNLTGEALEVQAKVQGLQAQVGRDQAEVDRLTAAMKGPRGGDLQDELDVSQAELALDKNELDDATELLARVSGDQRATIQRELAAREAAMKKYDDQLAGTAEVAVISTARYGTLAGRVGLWFAQRSRAGLLREAEAQAREYGERMQGEETKLQAGVAVGGSGGGGAADGGQTLEEKKARVTRLEGRVAERTMVHLLEDRRTTDVQLADVYATWRGQVALQHRIIDHLLLNSLALVTLIVLGTMLAGALARWLLGRSKMDRRRERTLETILDLGVQLFGLLLIGLVTFGAPKQVPTILGLATAGLTVVFQDFILAFFGWFVLMGRNGIRVGDWVEINGVGGEVVEIGLFRTALLETGNWTDKGHPTGRRVTFINNFAITGQYFNFSTVGQWMWDEITLNVPPSEHMYETVEAIHKVLLNETEKDAQEAEAEWRSAVKTSGLSQFSAAPSVDLRPAASGVDLKVRYVTKATERFAVRNRLYQDALDVLHRSGVAEAGAAASAR